MLISEWQASFIAAVQNRQYHLYSPAMVESLMQPETDATAFKATAHKWFSNYEANNKSSTPLSQDTDPLTPRGLWKLIDSITDVVPPAMLNEQGDPLNTEDGQVIQVEA